MALSKSSLKQLGVIVLVVVIVGILVYVALRRESTAPTVPDNIAISRADNKGQNQETPYISTKFTPLGVVESTKQKVLSFIVNANENIVAGGLSKGTLDAEFVRKERAVHEQQVFEIMFPEPVLAAFRENQATLVARGVLDASRVNPLSNTEEAEQYIRNRFEAYIDNPQVSNNEKIIAIRALAHLDATMSYERTRAERILRGVSADSTPARLSSFLALSIPVAQAEWKTTTPCYKDDDPRSRVKGYNNIATCCNCGESCHDGCTYHDDCGVNSSKCNVPQGCLNLDCKWYKNAIWDADTGTCGCG